MSTLPLTASNFDSTLASGGLVLVDFWAPWCAPCRALVPVLDELAGEFAGQVSIAKVDIDAEPSLQARYMVMSVPTLILFKDGQPVEIAMGLQPRVRIGEMLRKHL